MLLAEEQKRMCCYSAANVDEHEMPSTYEPPLDIEG